MKELKNEENGGASVCGVLKWMEAQYYRREADVSAL